jgi:hypothetical protein
MIIIRVARVFLFYEARRSARSLIPGLSQCAAEVGDFVLLPSTSLMIALAVCMQLFTVRNVATANNEPREAPLRMENVTEAAFPRWDFLELHFYRSRADKN